MIVILATVLVISFFDLRSIIRKKQARVLVAYMLLAIASLAYGYYYVTHRYTASIIRVILSLFNQY